MSSHYDHSEVSLLDYYVDENKILIFLVKKNEPHPIVFEIKSPDPQYSILYYLRLCIQRLYIDFNGLPSGWEESPFKRIIDHSLKLPPKTDPSERQKGTDFLNSALDEDSYHFDPAYFAQLSNLILPAALKKHIENSDLLCFIPVGPIYLLPLHALKWNKDEYLIEKFGVTYSPTVSILKYCQVKNSARSITVSYKPGKCMVSCIGTSSCESEQYRSTSDLLSSFRWNKFVSLEGSTLTKDRLIHQMIDKDVIHIVHSRIFSDDNKGNTFESGLLLSSRNLSSKSDFITNMSNRESTNFFLTADEVIDMPLNADLLTLKFCTDYNMWSLSRILDTCNAFLYAGTSSLIMNIWDTDSNSSNLLLKIFYKSWLEEIPLLPKWKALQKAQQMLIKKREYAHPYYWAPYILIGDWL